MLERSQHAGHVLQRLDAPAGRAQVEVAQALIKDEVHQGARAFKVGAHGLGPVGGEKLHGVLVVGKHDAQKGARGLVDELHRALGGPLTCGVAVEHADDLRDALALHQLDVVQPKGRAQGGHRVGVARLVHGDDIGVALAHNSHAGRGHGLFGAVIRKQVLALVKDAGIARVYVLGRVLLGANDAPAKGDGAAHLVVDGKHHAVIEAVGGASVAVYGHVARDHLGVGETLIAKVRNKATAAGRESQAPVTADGTAKAARGQIRTGGVGPLPATAHEHRGVEGLGRT